VSNVKWNGDDFKRQAQAEMVRRLERASIVVERHAKRLISVSGTGVQTKTGVIRKVKGGPGGKGKTVYGAFPSAPGEPPHKQTGHLRRSVTHEVNNTKLFARIGTNVTYGRFLELGTKRMAPRPWLRRSLSETSAKVKQILGGTKPVK